MHRFKSVIVYFSLALLLIGQSVVAQEVNQIKRSDQSDVTVAAHLARRIKNLESILVSISETQGSLEKLQASLETRQARGREEAVRSKIKSVATDLAKLKANFNVVATKVDLIVASEEERGEFSWAKEAQELLEPLINEIKRLTSRPREINQLRSEIDAHRLAIGEAKQALDNIEGLRGIRASEDLIQALDALEQAWIARRKSSITQLNIANEKLGQKQGERKPFIESLQNVSQIFFRSRGRNLVIAVLVTFLFWFLIRKLHRYADGRGPSRAFSMRLLHVFFLVAYVVGTLSVFVLVLFVFGDWVLLILVMLLLVGLFWASKHAIPIFWSQITLLLDMGTVREAERLEYNGLPWKVSSLNFYTTLENPALEPGILRIPIRDLIELRSRPYSEEELWFPTQKGDWVVLSDGTYGKVTLQTVDHVELELKGSTKKYYSAVEFISFNPQVISYGFRINTQFGLDYELQSEITEKVVGSLKQFVSEALLNNNYGEDQVKLTVEFAQASSSALDIAVITDFDGSYAAEYQSLQRWMQKVCVDACNHNNWTIPFNQLTVHMSTQDTLA